MTPRERWAFAARRAGTHSLLVWAPLTLAYLVVVSARKGALAVDFAQAYLPAAHKVLHGLSPYPPATVDGVASGAAFVYPPLTAWLAAPLTVVPLPVAEALVTVLMVGLVVATLLLLDVRDWRCHLIAFLWVPTYAAIQTANLSLPIALGVAALWRFRNRTVVAALVAGALVALKLYLWPVVVWLAVTRRFRSALAASAVGGALVLASWATIGFAGLTAYPRLLNVLTQVEGRQEYTLQALLAHAVSWRAAEALAVLAGLLVLLLTARLEERASFVCAIAATALLSPIAHMSYFVLLLVPVALRHRTLRPLWALPLALWVAPQVANGRIGPTAFALLVVAATFVLAAGVPDDVPTLVRPLPWLLLPTLVLSLVVHRVAVTHGFHMLDFDAVRSGALAVLHGESPYPAATRAAVLPSTHLVYPPLVAYLFVPFALLPATAAEVLWLLVMLAAVAGTLAALGVRDYRCYAAAYAGYPLAYSLGFGTLGPVLTLAVALVWRWRDRPWRAAPLLAVAIVAKLFLWPLLLWLAATRRSRTAAAAAVLALALFVLPFAPLGWDTLHAYPQLLHVLDRVFGPASYSAEQVARHLGAHGGAVTVMVAATAAAFCTGIVSLGARGRDADALTVAIVASIVLSPVSWVHYYVLFLVPLALARPRFSRLWLLPIAFAPLTNALTRLEAWRLFAALALIALLTARCLDLKIGGRNPSPSVGAQATNPETLRAWTS